MTDEPLAITTDGAVVRITMTRPDRRNAFDATLIGALTAAFRSAPARPGARVVVLAGEGTSFSAGADLHWMRGSLALSAEQNRDDALALADMLAAISECPLPVVARVQGHALGGGGGLVCAADIAIAADDATIGFPEVRLGIVAAAISPYVVRRIGPGAARAMFLTGRAADPAEALRVGLVHAVAPADGLDDAVAATVRDLVAGGPQALAATKRLLDECSAPLAAGVREGTAERIAAIRVGGEAQAGIRAFLDRERAPWRS
jgi:methylglutaconyl-CoA hydratase